MTPLTNQRGFTLIEVIVVLVVLGVLTAVGSFGLERAMDGYNLAQANAESTQKAQNAVDRITIELANITYNGGLFRYNVTGGTANSITYIANFGGADETCTINQSGSQVQLVKTVANVMIGTFPLTDLVPANGLLFTYFDGNGNTVAATSADMRLIGIGLTVQVIPGVTRIYNARVALQR